MFRLVKGRARSGGWNNTPTEWLKYGMEPVAHPGSSDLTTKKKKSSTNGILLESQQRDEELAQQPTDEQQPRSFDNPVPMGPDLSRMYEEHKKVLARVSGPYTPRTTREEDELMFARIDKLGKRDRRNPERNYDLMPEKEIVEEKISGGLDEGATSRYKRVTR